MTGVGLEVFLRPFTDADTDPLRAAFVEPDIARWNPGDPDDVVGWWQRRNDWSDGSHRSWAVSDHAGTLLGSVSLYHVDHDHLGAELGYFVLAAVRRRGVGRRATAAATRYAFDQLGMRRVELYHAVENRASCRVALAGGFRLEGTLRESYRYADGAWHDEHLHARLRTDPPS